MLRFRLVAFFLLAPVAVAVANSEYVASLIFAACQPQSLHGDYRDEAELAKELDDIDQEIRRRIEIKDALVDQLIAGRATLAEVTQQFLVMNQNCPATMTVIRSTFRGDTDEEKTARNVIGYTTFALTRATPAKRAEVLARLEAELDCFVAANRKSRTAN